MSPTNTGHTGMGESEPLMRRDDRAVGVLIADADPRVRTALKLFLESMPQVSSVGEVQTMDDLVLALKWLHPDVLLLDWRMANRDASVHILLLRALAPRLKRIVALSLSPEDRASSLAAGADAFVLKGDPPGELARAVCAGETTSAP